MPKPGEETRKKLAEITAERARLKSILDRQENLLKLIEEKGIPDSQPFISFKPAREIKDLAGQPGGLRASIKQEIDRIRHSIDQMTRDAKLVRREGYKEFVRRERAAVTRIDRQFEAEMSRVLKAAEARGHLTDEELGGLQDGADNILDAYTGLLALDSSEGAIKDVLNQIADVWALDGGDPNVVQRAMTAMVNAGRKNLDSAKVNLERAPSNKNARQLIRAATNLEMMGDMSGAAASRGQMVLWAESKKDTAERVFRSVPSAENLKRMLQAEITCVEMGGTQIKSPPPGLHRIKQGKRHPVVKGETLSGISKAYYGSFSFWDVLVRENTQLFENPDRPPTGVIDIPF